MAQESNTHDRYDLATRGENVLEDIGDVIRNISPTETPFQTLIGKETSAQVYKEWFIDNLATADYTNKHIDGDQFSGDALEAPARLGNYHQIAKKELVVTRRADKVAKAGRKSELAYQLAKKGRELKRDVEAILFTNQVAAAGNATTAPTTAGVRAWIGVAVDGEIQANSDRGALGADPALSGTNDGYVSTAATNGTKRALSEATLLSLIKAAYLNGGNPDVISVHPNLKQKLSTYLFSSSARVATQYQQQGAKPSGGVTVVGAVDVYVSDFGTFSIVPNRFQDTDTKAVAAADVSTLYILDPELWAVTYLDDYKTEEIAKVGDATRKHILVDFALVCKHPLGNAVVADIEDDVAVTT